MITIYVLIGCILVSFVLNIVLIRKKTKKDPIEVTVQNPKMEEKVEKVEEEKIKEKVEEEKIDLQKIESLDKDKPFARISSPSKIETAEFDRSIEPVVPIMPKQKRKYIKKQKLPNETV